ncbi:MAG: flavodoxin family protein [Dorea sp.]
MKTAIIYYSKHHENTKKILDAIQADSSDEITLIDATQTKSADLNKYNVVGFASGIYYSKFHKTVLQFAQDNLPSGKKVFFIYTYGAKKEGYTKSIRETLSGKNANILGEYGCYGFDTFEPFKLIGGIAKNHPTADEINAAVQFYKDLFY